MLRGLEAELCLEREEDDAKPPCRTQTQNMAGHQCLSEGNPEVTDSEGARLDLGWMGTGCGVWSQREKGDSLNQTISGGK